MCDIIVTTKKNGGLRRWHISRPVLNRNEIAVQGQVFQKSPVISGDGNDRDSRENEVTNADGSIKENLIGSTLVCYERWYEYSRMRCSDCHIVFYNYNITRAEFTHPTVYKVEIDGVMRNYCPKCGYTG